MCLASSLLWSWYILLSFVHNTGSLRQGYGGRGFLQLNILELIFVNNNKSPCKWFLNVDLDGDQYKKKEICILVVGWKSNLQTNPFLRWNHEWACCWSEPGINNKSVFCPFFHVLGYILCFILCLAHKLTP